MTEYDPQEAFRDAVENLSDTVRELTSELDCIENQLKDLTETVRSKFGDIVDELKKFNQGAAHEVPLEKTHSHQTPGETRAQVSAAARAGRKGLFIAPLAPALAKPFETESFPCLI